MEDEGGVGGHSELYPLLDSGCVSELPLIGKLPDECVAEVIDGDNQSEEVFAAGDGEEIMVEVVGSDVYVDGVGGNGEGNCDMAEAGNLDGGVVVKSEESTDVLRKEDGNKMNEGGLWSSELRDGKHGVTKEVDTSLSISTGVQAEKVSALPVGEVGDVNDETSTEASVPPEEVAGISPEDISEEKDTEGVAVDKDVSDVKEGLAEGKEILPKSDNSTSHIRFAVDSVRSDGKTEETHDGSDGVIGQFDSLNASGGELPDSGTQKEGSFMTEVESPNTDGDSGIQEKSVLEKDVRAAEGKDSINKPGAHTAVLDVHVKDVNAAENKTIKNVVISLVKDVNGRESGENGMAVDSEILGKPLTGHGAAEIPAQDDSTENMPLQQEAASSEVKIADATVAEDPCHDPNSEGVSNVGECGLPKSMEEVVASQVAEALSHEADNLEKTKMMPHEVSAVAADSADTAQVSMTLEGNGNTELLLSSTDILLDGGGNEEKCDKVYKSTEADEVIQESNGYYAAGVLDGHKYEATPMEVEEERDSDRTCCPGQDVDTETAIDGPSSESDKLKMPNVETGKYSDSLRIKQLGYLNPPEDEGSFAPSDLVWGKVRSHPWWPGQIFDPEDASEKAGKHHRKDSYLVAYFGDQTFAWNDPSALKPFRPHFSQIEKQSNSESFHNAVNCALEEVKRRVQLGMSCSCVPKDDYAKIGTQVLENTGIREESSQRSGVDQSTCASHFEPSELLEFIRAAAPCASSGADRLDLVIAQAQLSTFCSFKGYRPPIEFPSSGELLENDGDTEQISDEAVASHKRRHILKEGAQSRKERSLMELMGGREYSLDGEDESVTGDFEKPVSSSTGKKCKALDPLAEGSDKRASVSTQTNQAPNPSFKIGECIRRVANKLTGSMPLVKEDNDEMAVDGSPSVYEPSEKQSVAVSVESLSVSDMLSQLELLAQDPKKRHPAQNQIRAFFTSFRRSTTIKRRGRKKKSEQAIGEEFEFDDVNDSYWKDRIVQNYSAEQLLHERMNGSGSLHVVPFNMEKTGKAGRKPHSKKRFFSELSPTSGPESEENAKRIKQESSPAELILSFAERNGIPSEINLNKMFRRFGPLMESETEVDHESGSAKVIFKRGSDAEVARNSAEKFSIFGPVVVSYQIGYSPVISVKILPVSLPHSQDDATLVL